MTEAWPAGGNGGISPAPASPHETHEYAHVRGGAQAPGCRSIGRPHGPWSDQTLPGTHAPPVIGGQRRRSQSEPRGLERAKASAARVSSSSHPCGVRDELLTPWIRGNFERSRESRGWTRVAFHPMDWVESAAAHLDKGVHRVHCIRCAVTLRMHTGGSGWDWRPLPHTSCGAPARCGLSAGHRRRANRCARCTEPAHRMPGCSGLPHRTGAPEWSPPDALHRGLHSPSGLHSHPARRSPCPLIPSGGPARSATGSAGRRGTGVSGSGAGRAAASATGTATCAAGPRRRAAPGARAAPTRGAAKSGGPSGPPCLGGLDPLHLRLLRRLRGRPRGPHSDRRSGDWLCSRRRAALRQQFGRRLPHQMCTRTGSSSVVTGGTSPEARAAGQNPATSRKRDLLRDFAGPGGS